MQLPCLNKAFYGLGCSCTGLWKCATFDGRKIGSKLATPLRWISRVGRHSLEDVHLKNFAVCQRHRGLQSAPLY